MCNVNAGVSGPAPLARAVAVILVLAIAGCERGDPSQGQAPARPPAVVQTVAAVTQRVPLYLAEIGRAVATEVVSIVPQVGGRIVAVHVEDGASIQKGQLLFEIDPRPFEAALAAARATLAQGRAELDWAQVEYKRIEGLIQSSSASPIEFDQKRTALAGAEARVEAALAAVQTAELNLEFTKIYSPIGGRAGARLTDPGNVVRANEGSLLVIQRLDPIYVEFTVTEDKLGTLRGHLRGNPVTQAPGEQLRVQVEVPGDPGEQRKLAAAAGVRTGDAGSTTQPVQGGTREGRLTFMDNVVQSGTGTVRLRATVENADQFLWPGQFVNARLILAEKADAVLIPAEARQLGQQGPFVYVVKPDATAEIRQIVAGQRQGRMLVVESGVHAGENVIVSGHLAVMPGAKVMVANGPAGAPGADPAPVSAKASH